MHTAVQENNLEMRNYAWESMLPFHYLTKLLFNFNKTHYARNGKHYA